MMLQRVMLIANAACLVAALAVPVRAEDVCTPIDVWSGAPPERDVRLVRSGDRLLVATRDRVMVVGPGDVIEADHPRPAALALSDSIVGVDGGFWQLRRPGTNLTIDRLGLDGLPTGQQVILAADRGQIAVVDARDALVAVAWSGPRAANTTQDLHLTLMRADGAIIAEPVLQARPATLSVAPVIGNGVVWLVWNEQPDLRMVGMRFDATDGHPLDASPIAIGDDINPDYPLGAMPVRVGATLRVYLHLASGGVSAFELGDDGAVTMRPPTDPSWYLIGSPSGAVFQVAAGQMASGDFPQLGTVAITHEEPSGAFAPFVDVPGIAAEAVALGDGLAVATVVDIVAGDAGTSQVVLRRFTATGATAQPMVLVQSSFTRSDGEFCDDDSSGCTTGGTGAGLAPLALALALMLGRRRRVRAPGM